MKPSKLGFLIVVVVLGVVEVKTEYEGNSCRALDDKINGTCISIHSCPKALQAFETTPLRLEVVGYLRKLQCGFSGYTPLVCCSDQIDVDSVRPTYQSLPNRPNTRPPPRIPGKSLLPNKDECGQGSLPDRIFSGQIADIDEFPWMALLGYRTLTRRIALSCGGTLISKRYVLTAGHCVAGKINEDVGTLELVRLGEYDTNTDRDCIEIDNYQDCTDPVQDIQVEQAIAHSGFGDNNINRKDDIALVRLIRDVKYTEFIQPICLPPASSNIESSDLYVAGWGQTEKAEKSNVKMKVVLPHYDKDKCSTMYGRLKAVLTPKQICAGGTDKKDACRGDSGGPLMFRNHANWELHGIVSFGTSCGRVGWPGVYTDVSKYLGWISENMQP